MKEFAPKFLSKKNSTLNTWCSVALNVYKNPSSLLAGQLPVEAAQCDRKRLERAQRVPEIHRENVVRRPAKLHHDVVRVGVVHQLKVLNGRLRDPAVEVEHVRLRLVVPDGRLVVQFNDIVHVLWKGKGTGIGISIQGVVDHRCKGKHERKYDEIT